ncbi:MAG: DUF2959 family protein [Planctomycetota bacterium]
MHASFAAKLSRSTRSLAMAGLSLPLLLALTACDSMYYATMETFGYAKRDLLVGRVQDARESQGEAKETIQTTFEAFKGLTGFDGGELETQYNKFKSLYDGSVQRAGTVTDRIASIEEVSTAMFDEWGQEIAEIQSSDLRAKSERLKADTESSYVHLLGTMKAAEERMKPVLAAFKDQVLFLKHNLNAAAINSLESESQKIQSEVASLIEDMQEAIDEADEFIESLPK